MTYRTTLSPQDFATAITRLGFQYLETSEFSTTYFRGNDLLSVEDPEHQIYCDLEVATDFRFTDEECAALKLRKMK